MAHSADGVLLDAMQKAKDSVTRFLGLLKQPNNGIQTRSPLLSSAGVTEHLWAEVLLSCG